MRTKKPEIPLEMLEENQERTGEELNRIHSFKFEENRMGETFHQKYDDKMYIEFLMDMCVTEFLGSIRL